MFWKTAFRIPIWAVGRSHPDCTNELHRAIIAWCIIIVRTMFSEFRKAGLKWMKIVDRVPLGPPI